ncbi:MAG: citrulline utilization hydrolase CtlX [Gammaproteobacteria bacterium]
MTTISNTAAGEQTTDTVLMIRPHRFFANPETAKTNAFMTAAGTGVTTEQALEEFTALADTLRQHGVTVVVVDDTAQPATPDAVFPNNWFSTHADGRVVTYPMQPVSRRGERRADIFELLTSKHARTISEIIDLSELEARAIFLEGTGSLVLDRVNRIAYACLSARTHEIGLAHFCQEMDYLPVAFHARGDDGTPIYHTNVMMCVGDAFVVACLESVEDADRERVAAAMQAHRELIPITLQQMNAFAGNMLQLIGQDGQPLLVMSGRARAALDTQQVAALERHVRIVAVPINAIEDAAGGSVRCMLAEVFLPRAVESSE